MIREARGNDAKNIAKIKVDGWKTAYKGLMPETVLSELNYEVETDKVKEWLKGFRDEKYKRMIVYEENDEILGFAYFGDVLDEEYSKYQGEVIALYVLQEKKGNGIGTELLNAVKVELRGRGYSSMIIWCLDGNLPSIGFYEKMGGVIKERREFVIEGLKVNEIGLVYELG